MVACMGRGRGRCLMACSSSSFLSFECGQWYSWDVDSRILPAQQPSAFGRRRTVVREDWPSAPVGCLLWSRVVK